MSSRTLTAAVQTALDLCRDAFGNGISGQEERSLRYIALAAEQLVTTIQYLESKGDARKSMALESLTKSLRLDTHPAYRAFPEIDPSRSESALSHWKTRDLPKNVLRAMNIDTLPPELQAELAKAKATGGMVTFKLTQAQAMELFCGMPDAS